MKIDVDVDARGSQRKLVNAHGGNTYMEAVVKGVVVDGSRWKLLEVSETCRGLWKYIEARAGNGNHSTFVGATTVAL